MTTAYKQFCALTSECFYFNPISCPQRAPTVLSTNKTRPFRMIFGKISIKFDRKVNENYPRKEKAKLKQFVNNEVTGKPAGHVLGKFLNSE